MEGVETSRFLLKKLESLGPEGQRDIVTGDETYVLYYEQTTRQKSKVWVPVGSDRPVRVKSSAHMNKVLYAVFFTIDGLLAQIPSPEGHTVIGQYYGETILLTVVSKFQDHRSGRDLLLHHDNAPAHRSAIVLEYLRDHN